MKKTPATIHPGKSWQPPLRKGGLDFGHLSMVSPNSIDILTLLWYPSIGAGLSILPVLKEDTVVDRDSIEASVLHAFEVSLEAQLKAVKRLRAGPVEMKPPRQRMSQVDMVYDILQRASKPLHVSEIIDRVEKVHGRRLERESIVSSLVKKVRRGDRFVRTDRNVFGLKEGK